MRAIHGGKATHDTSAAHKIATLLRGGLLPQASGYPAAMRATRDLLRRRLHLLRQRAEPLSHVQQTTRQDNLPAIGKKIADKANREGVAERFDEAAVQQNIAVDLALITYDEALLRELELSIIHTAKKPAATTLHLRPTVPGIGTILSRVRLYDIHHIDRFPRVQDFASYGRLVTCAKESAGNRVGPSGKNIGHAHLPWAFSAAAVWFLRNHPQGPKSLGRWEKTQDQGQALTSRAHTLARAVYDRLQRKTAVDRDLFRPAYERRAGEPEVSRDTQRTEPASSGRTVLCNGVLARQGVHLGLVSLSLTG